VAGPKAALMKSRFRVHDINWLGGGAAPDQGLAVTVKVRSTTDLVAARILDFGQGRANIELDEPQAGIAPGQACVFYDGERVLGGGWIERGDA
jgi:tRNA-specific 2-thiouridylase